MREGSTSFWACEVRCWRWCAALTHMWYVFTVTLCPRSILQVYPLNPDSEASTARRCTETRNCTLDTLHHEAYGGTSLIKKRPPP